MTLSLPARISVTGIRKIIAREFGGQTDQVLAALSEAMNQAMRTDLKGAHALSRRITALIPHFSGKDRAFLQRLVARYHHLSGQPGEALLSYRRARACYTRAGDLVSAARIGRAMVDVFMYLGRYDEAIRVGEKSAQAFKRNRLEMDWAQTICNIGNVYHRRDDHPRALVAYNRAYAVIAPAGQKAATALIEFNRGNILCNMGRLDEAARCYHEARDLYTELGMTLAATQAEYSLAYLLYLQGDATAALRAFEQVLQSFQALGDRRGAAQTRLDVIEIQLHLNLHTTVEHDVPAVANEFKALGMRYEQAKAWYFCARSRGAIEDLDGAAKAIARARRLLESEGNEVWDGSLDLLTARLRAFGGNTDDALELAESARRTFRRARDPRRTAAATLLLAGIEIDQGNTRRARRRLDSVLSQADALPASTLYEALWLDARLRRSAGDYHGARKSYHHAIEQSERMTAGVPADETRIFFLSDKLALFHELVSLLAGRREYAAALGVLSRSHRVRHSDTWPESPDQMSPDPESGKEEKRVRSRLRQLYGFPASLDRFGASQPALIRRYEESLWRLIQKSRRRLAGTAIPGVHPGWERGALTLPPDEGALAFTDDQGWVGAFSIVGAHIRYKRMAISWDEIRQMLARLYFFLEQNRIPGGFRARHEPAIIRNTENQLTMIAESLLWPVLDQVLDCAAVTIVPHALMKAVPFHALRLPDGRFATDQFALRYATGLPEIAGRDRCAIPTDAYCAIFHPGEPDSPEMNEEARGISGIYPRADLYGRERATRLNLCSALASDYDFVHIASHASAALDNPAFSEILLHDGPVYLFDLFGTRINAPMVTLSACQTGRPGVLPMGEVYGLAEAFLNQGAKCVLSSLWTVDDRVARVFMGHFYTLLSQSAGLNQAWTGAIHKIREQIPNPCHWAPFVLIGTTD